MSEEDGTQPEKKIARHKPPTRQQNMANVDFQESSFTTSTTKAKEVAPTLDENAEDTKIQIKKITELYKLLKERKTEEYLHFKVKRQKLSTCCNYYHHFVLLEVIELKKEEQKEKTNENKPQDHEEESTNVKIDSKQKDEDQIKDEKEITKREIDPKQKEQIEDKKENKTKEDKTNTNGEKNHEKEKQKEETNGNKEKYDETNTNGKIEPEKREPKEESNGNKTKYTIKVMVAHYTSSKEIFTNNSKFGIGKFISETIIVKNTNNVGKKLFDFESELYLVNQPMSTRDHTIRERLYNRLGEQMYDFGANNCEHAVNYILTGKSESKESKSRPRCADLLSAAFGELKEFGLKVAMMIALVSSLAGSLTRYSYIRLLIAGVAAERSDIGVNETCSNRLGDNIILEAKVLLDTHSEIPRFSEIQSSEDTISDIKASLNNPFLCEIAKLLAMEALTKTFWLSVCMSVSVETMFLITRILFVYIPLFEIQIKKDFFRMVLVRLIAGYLSIPIGILGGSVGQAYLSPPALYFFVFAFFASLIARYILTIVASCMYECLYCCFCECFCKKCEARYYECCKKMCCDCCCACCCLDTDQNKTKRDVEIGCSSSDEESLNPKNTFKHYLCVGAAALCYSLCVAGIIVALYYFLD